MGLQAQPPAFPTLTAPPTPPTDPTAVKLENFPIHAITGVLKQWLRELPEPLMTFAQYGDFLRAVGESHGGSRGGGGQEVAIGGQSLKYLLWPVREEGPASLQPRNQGPGWGPLCLPHTRPRLNPVGGSPGPWSLSGWGWQVADTPGPS